jgi:gluconate 2-dehydrogenase alpha chain
MRITMDLKENEIKQNKFLADKFAEIIKAMGAQELAVQYRTAPYDITTYQTTHLNGGAIMGADPKTSALNRYLQNWNVPNLFVLGASAFPQNPGYNPTLTVGALAFWAADAIRNQYLKNPRRGTRRFPRSSTENTCSHQGAWRSDASSSRAFLRLSE